MALQAAHPGRDPGPDDRLYPTPARRGLLDAIAAGQVHTVAKTATRADTGRRVTAAVTAMAQAGWSSRPTEAPGWVQLTAVGRAVRAVRLMDFGARIVAETGPTAAPTEIGAADRAGRWWTVTVAGSTAHCRSRTLAADELLHRAVRAVAAGEQTSEPNP